MGTPELAFEKSYREQVDASEVLRATRRSLWPSAAGAAKTLYTGNKWGGTVRAYDHHAHHGDSPPDSFRVEVEGRTWCRTYGDIPTVADLGATSVTHLYLDRSAWAGMDSVVVDVDLQLKRLYSLTEGPQPILSTQKLVGVVGREQPRRSGIPVSEGNTTQSERRRLLSIAGVATDRAEISGQICLDPRYDRPLVEAAA